jgi:hypothetical protein
MMVWRSRHVIAVVSGFACFAAIYAHTGDADIFVTLASVLSMSAMSYMAAYLALTLQSPAD